jgi:hypothetical protein
VQWLTDALAPMGINKTQIISSGVFKYGDDPIHATEIYVIPMELTTVQACKGDTIRFKQPKYESVHSFLTKFAKSFCATYPICVINDRIHQSKDILDIFINRVKDYPKEDIDIYTFNDGSSFRITFRLETMDLKSPFSHYCIDFRFKQRKQSV